MSAKRRSRHRCLTAGCSNRHTTQDGHCWQHRPAPPVTVDGDRVTIGPLALTRQAARELADAIHDTLEGED